MKIRAPLPFLLLVAACAAPTPTAGTPLTADSGLREVTLEAFGLE